MNDKDRDLQVITTAEKKQLRAWASHLAKGPDHVLMVCLSCNCGCTARYEIFSDLAQAEAWVDRELLAHSDVFDNANVAALIINQPAPIPPKDDTPKLSKAERARMN